MFKIKILWIKIHIQLQSFYIKFYARSKTYHFRKPENSTPLQTSLIFNDLADLPPLPVVDPVQLTTWEPLVSPDNCDWVRGELTEEQQWLHSLKVPKEWLENRKTDYTESPTVSRRRTVKKIKTSKDSCEDSARVGGGVGGWYLLRHHHQSLVARGVAMTLNRWTRYILITFSLSVW